MAWLGIPGRRLKEPCSYWTTKVGGNVQWVDGIEPPGGIPRCEAVLRSDGVPSSSAASNHTSCGRQMSLILQAYAPYHADKERLLLIFSCVRRQCQHKSGRYEEASIATTAA